MIACVLVQKIEGTLVSRVMLHGTAFTGPSNPIVKLNEIAGFLEVAVNAKIPGRQFGCPPILSLQKKK